MRSLAIVCTLCPHLDERMKHTNYDTILKYDSYILVSNNIACYTTVSWHQEITVKLISWQPTPIYNQSDLEQPEEHPTNGEQIYTRMYIE